MRKLHRKWQVPQSMEYKTNGKLVCQNVGGEGHIKNMLHNPHPNPS